MGEKWRGSRSARINGDQRGGAKSEKTRGKHRGTGKKHWCRWFPVSADQRGSVRISADGRKVRKRKENTQECGKNIGAGGSRSARINADQRGSARMGAKCGNPRAGDSRSARINADHRGWAKSVESQGKHKGIKGLGTILSKNMRH